MPPHKLCIPGSTPTAPMQAISRTEPLRKVVRMRAGWRWNRTWGSGTGIEIVWAVCRMCVLCVNQTWRTGVCVIGNWMWWKDTIV